MNAKAIAGELGEAGICVCPDFLSGRRLRHTADDLESLRADGHFQRAGVGRGEASAGERDIRDDSTYWLSRGERNPAQIHLWRKVNLLRTALNRSLFLGLTDFEGHYAAYPAGGHYGRHKDCFRGDSARVVSFVLYLNRAWESSHGGRLRVYEAGIGGGESHRDIDPVGGTMVCFMSAASEHEVMLSHEARTSFTGWFTR